MSTRRTEGTSDRPAPWQRPFCPSPACTVEAFGPGRLVGETFRMLGRIGGGAMSVVFRARDLRLDREVAIKVMRPDAMEVPTAPERFRAQARAMARVRHPNVVAVEMVSEWLGFPYVVMEYVRGIPLDEWLALREIRPPTLDEAFALVDRICLGVEAVHASGGSFHDLTAGDFLVGAGLRAVVADLGVSRTLSELRRDGRRLARDPATAAPELALATPLGPDGPERADVYATASLAYRVLVGRYPVEDARNAEAPRSPLVGADLPEPYAQALLSALAASPVERTASVHELRLGLYAARKAARRAA